jgi:hypothetical protein
MTASQRFGRFAIPFRLPLLFSARFAQVTAAETSSREGKRCPHMVPFNLWNTRKSTSGGFISGLYDAWDNTPHSYLLSKSVTTFPRCGRALSCKMCSPSRASQVGFCADLWLHLSKFWGLWGVWTSPLVWLGFHLRFRVSKPRFVSGENSIQKCLTFYVKSLFQ